MRRRHITALGIIAVIILGIYYALFVLDSPFNFYKKIRIENYAEEYIAENYPDFKAKNVTVSYDSAFQQYVADCIGEDMTISLNYSGSFFMEYDEYYNEKYTAKAIQYQNNAEAVISEALSARGIAFDSVSVFVDLNASEKKDIVFNDTDITNGKIECTVTLVRDGGEEIMNKYALAEYSMSVADCVYNSTADFATISDLEIKYDYDTYKLATLSWSKRMNDMSIYEIANEIKY